LPISGFRRRSGSDASGKARRLDYRLRAILPEMPNG
jgi:hypothetical protein